MPSGRRRTSLGPGTTEPWSTAQLPTALPAQPDSAHRWKVASRRTSRRVPFEVRASVRTLPPSTTTLITAHRSPGVDVPAVSPAAVPALLARNAPLRRPALAAGLLALLPIGAACAQGRPAARPAPAVPASHGAVREALRVLRADNAWTLDQQASICEVPAPPFKEAARAAEYRRRLEALGLRNVRIDAEGNV